MSKPCAYPGCNELVAHGYCSKHYKPESFTTVQKDKEIHRLYDRKWRARRLNKLAADPWCEDCLEHEIWNPATDIHHVIRHRGDVSVFNTSPLISLCHSCHSKRTQEETRRAPEKF